MYNIQIFPDVYNGINTLARYINKHNIRSQFTDDLEVIDHFIKDKDGDVWDREQGQVIFLRDGKKIIGFLVSQYDCLCYLYINSEYRNKGLGKLLVELFIFDYIHYDLLTPDFNPNIVCFCEDPLRSYYENLGFIYQGKRNEHYNIMHKPLDLLDYRSLTFSLIAKHNTLKFKITRDSP